MITSGRRPPENSHLVDDAPVRPRGLEAVANAGREPAVAQVEHAEQPVGALTGTWATTALGTGVLVLAITPILGQFGLLTAASITLAYLASLIVLPPALLVWVAVVERRPGLLFVGRLLAAADAVDVDSERSTSEGPRTDGGTDGSLDAEADAFEWQTDPEPPGDDPSQKR